jgi:nitrate reductase NapE component
VAAAALCQPAFRGRNPVRRRSKDLKKFGTGKSAFLFDYAHTGLLTGQRAGNKNRPSILHAAHGIAAVNQGIQFNINWLILILGHFPSSSVPVAGGFQFLVCLTFVRLRHAKNPSQNNI